MRHAFWGPGYGGERLRAVDADSNPLYSRLIDAIRRQTGVGMVLNQLQRERADSGYAGAGVGLLPVDGYGCVVFGAVGAEQSTSVAMTAFRTADSMTPENDQCPLARSTEV